MSWYWISAVAVARNGVTLIAFLYGGKGIGWQSGTGAVSHSSCPKQRACSVAKPNSNSNSTSHLLQMALHQLQITPDFVFVLRAIFGSLIQTTPESDSDLNCAFLPLPSEH